MIPSLSGLFRSLWRSDEPESERVTLDRFGFDFFHSMKAENKALRQENSILRAEKQALTEALRAIIAVSDDAIKNKSASRQLDV
jgi:hypothetical protein